MNPNNFFPLDAFRFINIIDGTDSYYSTPQRAVPLMNQNRYNEALKASGLPPECTVYIPTLDLRTTGWKEQTIYQHPEENRPNPHEPYIYKISTPIFWNRGMNTSTGEGPKAELACGIDLLNCEFNGSFHIADVSSKAGILFKSCYFLPSSHSSSDVGFIANRIKFKEVNLYGDNKELSYIKRIKITDSEIETLSIGGLKIDELIISGAKTKIKILSVYNCEIDSILFNSDTTIGDLSIAKTVINHKLSVHGIIEKFHLTSKQLFDDKIYPISRLSLGLNNQDKKGIYSIKEAVISKLEITDDSNNRIDISESSIIQIYFDFFNNTGELRLQNIHDVNFFSIKDSSMGNAVFFNVDFSMSRHLAVTRSSLLEMTLMNTTFPSHLKASTDTDYTGIREAFRQLKFISSKHGNRIQELAYEASEMDAYKKDDRVKKTWDEEMILSINEITNNHGQSWLRAFLLLLLFTVSMFSVIKSTLGYTIVWGSFSYSDINDYLEFSVNPLHDFGKIFKSGITISTNKIEEAKTYDFLSRLCEGIILFQLVRAFRKYARSDAG